MGSVAKVMLLDLYNNGYKGFDIGQLVAQYHYSIGINKETPEDFWKHIEDKNLFLQEERKKLLDLYS